MTLEGELEKNESEHYTASPWSGWHPLLADA
nr:MAG TPA: hypothetical protein [Caudoviricetes sp.]